MMKKLTIVFIIIALGFLPLFAGKTGKIAGIITDAGSGDPLAGVNVFLEGTALGAATDLDGYYAILNVQPGNYQVNVHYVGYKEARVTDVIVKIDLTTRLDLGLEAQILETDVVIVEAHRPVVTPDISNSQMNIEAKEILSLPVQSVDQVLTLQAGIEMGSQGIIVRHGAANQTVFMVDGMATNDERSQIPYTTMSLSSIEEVKVQTGGFTADYGDARSGLVNVVTKEGPRDRYNASVILNYRPADKKNFGPSPYRWDSYFNRPFMDPAVCWTGTGNGAWDSKTRRQYPNFEGWNSVSERTLEDDNPANDLTPEGAKRLFEWQRRREGDITKPDYIIDFGFGGPIPLVSNDLGNLRFFLSHRQEQDMFIFPLSYDAWKENYTQLKLTSDLSPSMKLMFTGMYGEVYSVSPYQWTTAPTGDLLRSDGQIADLLTATDGPEILYMPGYYSPANIYRSSFGINFTHAIDQSLFYDVYFQFKTNKYHTYKTEDRDLNLNYEPVPGYKADESPYGYYGYSTSAIDGTSMGGWMNLGRDESRNSSYTLKFDLTSQMNPSNQLKTGFQVVYTNFDANSGTESPSMNTWTRSQIYNVSPFRVGAYVFDKIEYQDFIANVGVRLDYSQANSGVYQLETYDTYFKAGYGNSIEEDVPTVKSEADWSINPRLGISHPITEDSKLYFNYNHFRSEPSSTYRFRMQRESNGLVTSIGNPNLFLEKTISYELGYEHNLFGQYLLKAAAYYKDVTGQPGWVYYENIDGSVKYSITENSNYEDIRGIELTLSKRIGPWITGFINYTYDVITEGYFGYQSYYEDPNKQRNYVRLNPQISRPHPQPYARANINLTTPSDFGPELGGIQPLADWYMNILANWRAGSYYLYVINEQVEYDIQRVDTWGIDLRLAKIFTIADKVNLQLYVDVSNVFNFKYLSFAGFSDTYDRENYLASLNFPWEKGDEKGDDKIGKYRPVGVDFDPLESNPNHDPEIAARNNVRKENNAYIDMPNIQSYTFLYPRNITFGLRINF